MMCIYNMAAVKTWGLYHEARLMAYPAIFGLNMGFPVSQNWLTFNQGGSPWEPLLKG